MLTGTAGIDTEHAGYTGSGFVDGIQTIGSGATVDVVAPKAGAYDLADPLRQRSQPAAQPDEEDEPLRRRGAPDRSSCRRSPTGRRGARYTVRVTCRPASPRGDRLRDRVTTATSTSTTSRSSTRPVVVSRPRTAPSPVTATGSRPSTRASAAPATSVASRSTAPSVTFDVTATAAGFHDVKLGYANGPEPAGRPDQGDVGLRQRRLRQEAVAAAVHHLEGVGLGHRPARAAGRRQRHQDPARRR